MPLSRSKAVGSNRKPKSVESEKDPLKTGTKNSSPKVKFYKQNFRECWLVEFRPWMSRSPTQPNSPYCTYCDRQLEGGASHIKRHALSNYHRKKEEKHLGKHPEDEPTELSLEQKHLLQPACGHQDTESSFVTEGILIQSVPQNEVVHSVTAQVVRQGNHEQQQQYIATSQQLTSSHHIDVPHIELTHMEAQHLQSQALASNEEANTQLQASSHLVPVDAAPPHDVAAHSGLEHTDLHGAPQEVIIASSTATSDGSLFQPTLLHHSKPADGSASSYMVEFEDPGSSTEVTVANSTADITRLGSEGAHITVTIQGHDPMYIHSAAEPALSYGPHGTELKSEPLSHDVKQENEPSLNSKKPNRTSKASLKKRKLAFAKDSPSLGPPLDTSQTSSSSGTLITVRRPGTADLQRSRRWYRQKYASHWDGAQEFADWLTRAPADPNTAYCLACAKSLFGGMAHLRRHSLTPYHKKRMVETQKKRQVQLAHQAELRISAYAQQHGLSETAVTGLPELLRRILPDSNLVGMLSEERLSAMMLVRKENAAAESPHQVGVQDQDCTQFRAPSEPRINRTEPSVSQHNVYQTRQQIQFASEVECKQNLSLHLKQQTVPCSHLTQHYQPLQHQATSHSSPLPIPSHAIVADNLPTNASSYSNSSHYLSSSQERYISVHDQQSHHPDNNGVHSQSYHITQVHNMPQQSHSDMQDHHQQDHHHHQQQQQQHQHHNHLCPTSSSSADGRDRNSLLSEVAHPPPPPPPTSIRECEVPSSCHTVSVLPPHSQGSDQQQPGPQYGGSQAVPSPSQFETLPASEGVCSRDTSSTTVLVHQADANNPETVQSYTITNYPNYSMLMQLSSGDVTRWQGRVAIVTGASSGIGAAICRSLVRLGMVVVGVARSHHRIKALSEELGGEAGTLTAIQCDMSKDDQVQDMFKQVIDTFGHVHLCINNAGFSFNSGLLDGTPEEWRAMLDVNVVGLCLLTKLSVQSMRERGIDDGHIINISSVFGHMVARWPNTHFYAATKHAIRALSEGLRQELREAKSHIRVSTISPGRCKTEFAQNMLGDPEVAGKIYSDIDCLTAEDVAASVVHVITAPPRVEINEVLMRPTEQIV